MTVTTAISDTFSDRFRRRTATIAIVGLGYVGLPLAVEMARAGFRVYGIDVDADRVRAINGGRSYIDDVTSEEITELVRGEQLQASGDPTIAGEADAVLICVPTPLTRSKQPDLSYVIAATSALVSSVHRDQLIVLESTTYPGTTIEVVRPILERSGLEAGDDFFLAFSPERLDPGNPRGRIRQIPKIVGGLTPQCTALASMLYEQITEQVVPVSSPTVAEMVKVYENVFRNVNIALVNELALLCDRMGLDVWEIIDAAATKPYGFMPFYPGPGVGGHCIPVDPYYLAAKAREYDFHVRFIELAATVNDTMPYHVVSRAAEALGSRGKPLTGARMLVLGVAYKADISDVRESPALKIMELLERQGAHVSYHDPYVPAVEMHNPGTKVSTPLTDETLASIDCVIIATGHRSVDYVRVAAQAPLVIDVRNVLRGYNGSNVERL